jgi:hypothetical protein
MELYGGPWHWIAAPINEFSSREPGSYSRHEPGLRFDIVKAILAEKSDGLHSAIVRHERHECGGHSIAVVIPVAEETVRMI